MQAELSSQFEIAAWKKQAKEALPGFFSHGIKPSWDGWGRFLDNTFGERLWRLIKYECVSHSPPIPARRRPRSSFPSRTSTSTSAGLSSSWDATEAQRAKVVECAQAVLAAREQFPGSTLADLYDPVAMPPALAKAHAAFNRAVDRCYRKEPFATNRQRVEFLFALYEQLAAPLVKAEKPGK